MAIPSSYFTSTKNLDAILERMQKGQVPSKFTYDHLKQLGFPSSNDRPVIPVLKALGLLDQNGVPTERYRRFKAGGNEAKQVLGEGVREAYADVFAIDEGAGSLPPDELKGIFARLSGKAEGVTDKMAMTFRALVKHADLSANGRPPARAAENDDAPRGRTEAEQEPEGSDGRRTATLALRHDVHVHLPVTDDIKVYDAIFRSLRENLLP
jgi:hypothetical protein